MPNSDAAIPAAPARSSARDRLVNLGWSALVATPVFIATQLRPDTSGLGTHRQLGLPPCAFYFFTGFPCPFCGMTTSWTWAAHGQLMKSFITQPMGFVFFVSAILLSATLAILAVIGFPALRPERVLPRVPRQVWWIAISAVAVAWVYKSLVVRGILVVG